MPRFVLLLHECPDANPRETHCDLMLEVGAVLETWTLQTVPCDWCRLDLAPPMIAASNAVEVERIADHRLAYLDYEGPISGGRGTVRRLDGGEYKKSAKRTSFLLEGRVLQGEVEIMSSTDSRGTSTLTLRPADPFIDR